MKRVLADLNIAELEAVAIGYGQPKFRGGQLLRWIGRGAVHFEEMTDLPKSFRDEIAVSYETGIPAIVDKVYSKKDGVVKYIFSAQDGNVVEGVLMRYKHGFTACISSQAGCRMGCRFCASKPEGFSRGLSCGEMLGQVLAMNRDLGERIGNVVVMGIGEPFDNYDNCLKFARLLHENPEAGIGYRKVTVSTCGVVPGIYRLAGEGLPIGLSVSLNAPNDEVRDIIMPINRKHRIKELLEACNTYICKTGRRVTFEYAMISGVNDHDAHAREVAAKLKNMLCHVNLIPVNRVEGSGFMPSSRLQISRFEGILQSGGVNATIRRTLGADIGAACGQLRKMSIQGYEKQR